MYTDYLASIYIQHIHWMYTLYICCTNTQCMWNVHFAYIHCKHCIYVQQIQCKMSMHIFGLDWLLDLASKQSFVVCNKLLITFHCFIYFKHELKRFPFIYFFTFLPFCKIHSDPAIIIFCHGNFESSSLGNWSCRVNTGKKKVITGGQQGKVH